MSHNLKVIPLGGLNEIGKNMTVLEYGGDILVIDSGIAFPDEEMLGVDLVIPDITYLVKQKSKIKAFVITHGHEDHIGALPYVLKSLPGIPIYCTRLTAGIIENRLEEHGLKEQTVLNLLKPGQSFKAGCFGIQFIRSNHSIPDAVGLAISTPVGMVIHTGDFKLDPTPIGGEMIDLATYGKLGEQGVVLLLSDSTNADRPGYTMSERKVSAAFDRLFKGCDKRIIVTSFASNVHRIQQVIDAAVNYGRKVALSGRSLENIINVAMKLDCIRIPKNTLIELPSISKYPAEKLCIITTGSQGEPMSALYRMAFSGHKQVEIGPHDRVIISASPIPGNEKTIYKVINELFKKGAEVVYEHLADVHVSGHACQEELKIILALTKPKNFMPVHGEYRHLIAHASIAAQMGISERNIFVGDIGKPLNIDKNGVAKFTGSVPSGRVFVDGMGVGDVGAVVLRDRKHLSQDGLIVVVVTIDSESHNIAAGPDIVTRGFIYVKESELMMEEMRVVASEAVQSCLDRNVNDWSSIKSDIKNKISEMLYKKTKRRPMVIPVLMEV